MLNRDEYLENPCGRSSVPYWKAVSIAVPAHMKIVHEAEFDERLLLEYVDEPYFRLKHELKKVQTPALPKGFALCDPSVSDWARQISACYPGLQLAGRDVEAWKSRRVYRAELWLAIADVLTGEIAASGIAELDADTSEGALEWIQTTEKYRGCGLGRYIVNELLRRMQGRADFATVSGQINNKTNPETLYRACGFTGSDRWHVLTRRV